MSPGLIYYYIKKYSRAWLKMQMLSLYSSYYIKKVRLSKYTKKGYIVSLTSMPSRIDNLHYVLLSILSGNWLPEAIILSLSSSEMAIMNKKIEKSHFYTQLVNLNFLIVQEVQDFKSFKKIIFTLDKYPNYNIIICDDDVLYPKFWLKSLIKSHESHSENTVIAHRVHEIKFDESSSTIKPYSEWQINTDKLGPSNFLFPTGVGGVLYPPGSLRELARDSKLFLNLCPNADDIWFWLCALNNGYKILNTDKTFNSKDFLEIPNSQIHSLHSSNVHENKNDEQLKNALEFFDKNSSNFISQKWTMNH